MQLGDPLCHHLCEGFSALVQWQAYQHPMGPLPLCMVPTTARPRTRPMNLDAHASFYFNASTTARTIHPAPRLTGTDALDTSTADTLRPTMHSCRKLIALPRIPPTYLGLADLLDTLSHHGTKTSCTIGEPMALMIKPRRYCCQLAQPALFRPPTPPLPCIPLLPLHFLFSFVHHLPSLRRTGRGSMNLSKL